MRRRRTVLRIEGEGVAGVAERVGVPIVPKAGVEELVVRVERVRTGTRKSVRAWPAASERLVALVFRSMSKPILTIMVRRLLDYRKNRSSYSICAGYKDP